MAIFTQPTSARGTSKFSLFEEQTADASTAGQTERPQLSTKARNRPVLMTSSTAIQSISDVGSTPSGAKDLQQAQNGKGKRNTRGAVKQVSFQKQEKEEAIQAPTAQACHKTSRGGSQSAKRQIGASCGSDRTEQNAAPNKGRQRRNSSNFNKAQVPQHPPVFEEPLKESKYLEFLLREKYQLFENDHQQKLRKEALKRLEQVANGWALEMAVKKGANEEEEKARPQIEVIVFGSYLLNVHSAETDVDVILVFRQKFVSQKEFLLGFVKLVQSLPDFSDLLSISQAKVPIIKVYCGDTQFDLLFASMEEPKNVHQMIRQANVTNSEQFKKLNEASQSSLLGRIACQNILNNVPSEQTFQLVLRAVRFWALQRGIYSINLGYLGGVTLAVMVAKICQDYPDLSAACTLYKFFETYAESSWREPVQM